MDKEQQRRLKEFLSKAGLNAAALERDETGKKNLRNIAFWLEQGEEIPEPYRVWLAYALRRIANGADPSSELLIKRRPGRPANLREMRGIYLLANDLLNRGVRGQKRWTIVAEQYPQPLSEDPIGSIQEIYKKAKKIWG